MSRCLGAASQVASPIRFRYRPSFRGHPVFSFLAPIPKTGAPESAGSQHGSLGLSTLAELFGVKRFFSPAPAEALGSHGRPFGASTAATGSLSLQARKRFAEIKFPPAPKVRKSARSLFFFFFLNGSGRAARCSFLARAQLAVVPAAVQLAHALPFSIKTSSCLFDSPNHSPRAAR